MAVRTAYDAVAGAVLTAVNLDKLAGGWIGYNEVTADQANISSADVTGLSVAVTVGTGRRIKVSAGVNLLKDANAGLCEIRIMEGATLLGFAYFIGGASTSGHGAPTVILTPTSGSHTYKITIVCSITTLTVKAAATYPAFILVEDMGATP